MAMSNREILLLTFSAAIVTANAYYIHPIIGAVADSFGVSDGTVGIVPALNQLALALGVLLLLPLGDQISNRKLVAFCLLAQVVTLVAMATVTQFEWFLVASTLLGFFTITPYLLPAYASRRVEPARLGFVTAMLTSGVVAGVQLSRLTSGLIGEFIDWRAVYWLAAVLMALSAVTLPKIMVQETRAASGPGYWSLLGSLPTLAMAHPRVMVSGLIQGLNFGGFIAIWLSISLHLTSDEMGYGSDLVGYLTAFGALSLLTTARLGKWSDGKGPEKARLIMALFQFVGILSFSFAGEHWYWLLPPIALTSIVGPLIDVTGRMTSLREDHGVRTRLMSLYITLMFMGGGLGSWGGTMAYHLGGWAGAVTLVSCFSLVVLSLSAYQWRASRMQPVSHSDGK